MPIVLTGGGGGRCALSGVFHCIAELFIEDHDINGWGGGSWVRVAHTFNNVMYFNHFIQGGKIEGAIQNCIAITIIGKWAEYLCNGAETNGVVSVAW